MNNIFIDNTYINEIELIYIKLFIKFIDNKYELKKISCYYSNSYNGYIFTIEKNKLFYLFIDKNEFNKFIMLEKLRDKVASNACPNLNNKLINNINNLLFKSYYFYNIDDLIKLKSIDKEYNKINDIYTFNNLIL